MFRQLMKLSADPSISKDAAAMRKDLPIPAELNIRAAMCASILVEYARNLLDDGKSPSDVRTEIMTLGDTFKDTNYVPTSFGDVLGEQMTKMFSERDSFQDRVFRRFSGVDRAKSGISKFADKSIGKAMEKFGLQVAEECIANTLREESADARGAKYLVATYSDYFHEAVQKMKNSGILPEDFVRKVTL
jgi:hypothetical protein